MNKIKFSHIYCKLENISIELPVMLLEVFTKEEKELSQSFLNYDTKFPITPPYQYYKLYSPNSKFIVLLFSDKFGNLFTTVRPFKEEKYSFYLSQRGKSFEVEIVKQQEKQNGF
jgi:hypothetical protein